MVREQRGPSPLLRLSHLFFPLRCPPASAPFGPQHVLQPPFYSPPHGFSQSNSFLAGLSFKLGQAINGLASTGGCHVVPPHSRAIRVFAEQESLDDGRAAGAFLPTSRHEHNPFLAHLRW